MGKRKRLSKRQLAVMNDLFSSGLDEQAVLDKHEVSRKIYNRWQGDASFSEEYRRRLGALNRESELIIARYASLAAAKLVQLTESAKEETARKACLDIISLPKQTSQKHTKKAEQKSDIEQQAGMVGEQLSSEMASRLLAALNEDDGNRKKS